MLQIPIEYCIQDIYIYRERERERETIGQAVVQNKAIKTSDMKIKAYFLTFNSCFKAPNYDLVDVVLLT